MVFRVIAVTCVRKRYAIINLGGGILVKSYGELDGFCGQILERVKFVMGRV